MDHYEIRHRAYPLIPRKKMSEIRQISSDYPKSWLEEQKLIQFTVKHWIALGIFLTVLTSLSIHLHNKVPTPLSHEPAGNPVFLESRARQCLDKLTQLGPRSLGSYENEVEARNFILGEIERLKKTASRVHHLTLDIQHPSDCFYVGVANVRNSTQCYRNVTNIALRLSSKRSLAKHALLLNCHFDSVPWGPGASDDAVNCCIMLEIANVLLRRKAVLAHDAIFLFNGAEESGLLAAHGFITKHHWRHDIRAFINLEAGGSGGREMLFQVGPGNPWLAKAYLASVPYPHVNVLAQEVFQSGLVPSDTDFRVFRDFGRKPGLDIAYAKNGYVYHTEFDTSDRITPGSVQRAGENVYALTVKLANSSLLEKPGDFDAATSALVFFDFLGLFTVQYPYFVGQILNLCVVIGAVYSLIRFEQKNQAGTWKLVLLSGIHVSSVFCTMFTAIICIVVVKQLGLTLCWYAEPLLLVPLYYIPALAMGFYVHAMMAPGIDVAHLQEDVLKKMATVGLAMVLLLVTIGGMASAYVFFILTFFLLCRDVLLKGVKQLGLEVNGTVLFLSHTLCATIPVLTVAYLSLEVVDVFVPILGRSGTMFDPEVFMGFFTTVLAIITVLMFGSLMHVTKHGPRVAKALFLVSAIYYVLCVTTSLGFPYRYTAQSPRVKRLDLVHAHRRKFDAGGNLQHEDTGVWIAPWDIRGYEDAPKLILTPSGGIMSAAEACITEDPSCGFPMLFTKGEDRVRMSKWAPSQEKPAISRHARLEQTHFPQFEANTAVYSFKLFGGDKILLLMKPAVGWEMQSWSFVDEPPSSLSTVNGTHFVTLHDGIVHHPSAAHRAVPWEFQLRLRKKDGSSARSNEDCLSITMVSATLDKREKDSSVLRNAREWVAARRQNPQGFTDGWKWEMTMATWSAEVIVHDF